MSEEEFNIDASLAEDWRDLGFYYEHDHIGNQIEWRFWGSKNGLSRFLSFLDSYTANPRRQPLPEHDHLGPYSYLKIMTWNSATIMDE